MSWLMAKGSDSKAIVGVILGVLPDGGEGRFAGGAGGAEKRAVLVALAHEIHDVLDVGEAVCGGVPWGGVAGSHGVSRPAPARR